MVFRLCLCVVLVCACGYATKSTDYCRVLVNYDTFKTSVDNFLASRDETCGNSDVRSVSGCGVVYGPRVLYTGTQSTTKSGKTCQRWDAQEPHTHDRNTDAKFAVPGFDTPQTVAGSANYCRDPARNGFLWCYTTNPGARWEMCDVPICQN
ncbi:plasminogen-like [Haliotis rufescens]|uniref:plasminogen-like n=1 Tax=Haliotis rufescens TaxID=6454 RepID=UPI00201F181E|nr:plasminogen-like [Haliotis rufescens]